MLTFRNDHETLYFVPACSRIRHHPEGLKKGIFKHSQGAMWRLALPVVLLITASGGRTNVTYTYIAGCQLLWSSNTKANVI